MRHARAPLFPISLFTPNGNGIRSMLMAGAVSLLWFLCTHPITSIRDDPFSTAFQLGVGAVITGAILCLPYPKLRISAWVVLIFSFATNVIHDQAFGGPISLGGLASMFETNAREARQFVDLVGITQIIKLVAFAGLILYSELSLGRRRPAFRPVTVICLLILVLAFPFARQIGNPAFYSELSARPAAWTARIYRGTPILGDVLLAAAYSADRLRLARMKPRRRPPTLIDPEAGFGQPELVVLVVGESTSRRHMSVHGYQVPTTPFLLAQRKMGNAVVFDQAVASSSITRTSLKLALSFASVTDQDRFYSEWNVMDLASRAGYRTIWLSNQSPAGMNDSAVGMLAQMADSTRFISREGKRQRLDQDLIPELAGLLSGFPRERLFVVVHLDGSRYDYAGRSTREDQQEVTLHGSLFPEYDATIRHTDRVLADVMGLLEADHRTHSMVFFSDHGEEVAGRGHGYTTPSRRQLDVPLIVWLDEAQSTWRQDELISQTHRLVSTERMTHLLARIMGWQFRNEGGIFPFSEPLVLRVDDMPILYSGIEAETLFPEVSLVPQDPAASFARNR